MSKEMRWWMDEWKDYKKTTTTLKEENPHYFNPIQFNDYTLTPQSVLLAIIYED
jgi:hypothetical protein